MSEICLFHLFVPSQGHSLGCGGDFGASDQHPFPWFSSPLIELPLGTEVSKLDSSFPCFCSRGCPWDLVLANDKEEKPTEALRERFVSITRRTLFSVIG